MEKKRFLGLFVLCLSAVLIFGGCDGGGDSADYLGTGKYFINDEADAEHVDHPGWVISCDDSYIRVFNFKKVGHNEYEITFSGYLEWYDSGFFYYTNLSQRTITVVKVDHYCYESKYSSDPYVYIEIFDDYSFELYYEDSSDAFWVSLER